MECSSGMPEAGHVRHQHRMQKACESPPTTTCTPVTRSSSVKTPPFGSSATRFVVPVESSASEASPSGATNASSFSRQKTEPLLHAFRESKHLKPEREKLVLKPSLLNDRRRAKRRAAAQRGPGSYPWHVTGPKASFVDEAEARERALHGVASPFALVRSISAPPGASIDTKAFPAPVSLKSLGLTAADAKTLREAVFNKERGWAVEGSTRDMYNVPGARHSFVPHGATPDEVDEERARRAEAAARAHRFPQNSFVEKALATKNATKTLMDNSPHGREGASIFPRKIGHIACGSRATETDSHLGPGYVDPVPFTEHGAMKKMKQLRCTSMADVTEKEGLLNVRRKIRQEKTANRARAQAEDLLKGQETFERRDRTNWTKSQRKLRNKRMDEGNKRTCSTYNVQDRMPSMRSPGRNWERASSPWADVNSKAVARTDDNYVRVLAEREQ